MRFLGVVFSSADAFVRVLRTIVNQDFFQEVHTLFSWIPGP
jgi:hypothetical protein